MFCRNSYHRYENYISFPLPLNFFILFLLMIIIMHHTSSAMAQHNPKKDVAQSALQKNTIHLPVHTHIYTHTVWLACPHTCVYTHVYTHTCIHTCIHIHTQLRQDTFSVTWHTHTTTTATHSHEHTCIYYILCIHSLTQHERPATCSWSSCALPG